MVVHGPEPTRRSSRHVDHDAHEGGEARGGVDREESIVIRSVQNVIGFVVSELPDDRTAVAATDRGPRVQSGIDPP